MEVQKKSRRTRHSEEERRSRVQALRTETGARLPTLSTSALEAESVHGHIENFIGTVSVPLGLAGPLRIEFPAGLETVRAPIGTTEGALVSSITRGALALSLSGGVRPRVLQQRMTRAPQFEFETLDQALSFREWVLRQTSELQSRVGRRSQHAKLLNLEAFGFGRTVHVRFHYSTGNAAGQNMTTFCTADLCHWLIEKFEAETGHLCRDFMIEGNLSSDKKASFISASGGRGHSVICEGLIEEKVLKRVLNISVDEIMDRFHRSKSARIFTGVLGFNINVANVVAGVFLATGQDMACVHESAVAEFHLERKGHDLYLSLLMPSLVVGTVGGGTQLPGARDGLEMLGCTGPGSSDRLAMIIASFALALEVSTMTAIGTDQFVSAHEKHSRGLTSKGLRPSDLDADFFQRMLADSRVVNVKRLEAENKEGHVSDLAFQVSKKFSGMLAFEIETRDGNHVSSRKKAFLKMKPRDHEIVFGATRVLAHLHPGLAELLLKNWKGLPFFNCHVRELEVFDSGEEVFRKLAPEHFGSFANNEQGAYILIQELLGGTDRISPMGIRDFWTSERIQSCFDRIAILHQRFQGKEEEASALLPSLLKPFRRSESEGPIMDLWDGLGDFVVRHLAARFPRLRSALEVSLENFESILAKLEDLPQTVLHYDFNPRNVAVRADGLPPVLFDWEFTAWGPAERDLFEFLIFASSAANLEDHFLRHTGFGGHRDVYAMVFREFLVRRLPFYVVMSQMGACPYLDDVLQNLELFAGWTSDV